MYDTPATPSIQDELHAVAVDDAVAVLAAAQDDADAWLKIGAVAQFWRNPIEEFHHRLSDPDMARLTIATTRDIRPYVALGRIDWERLKATLLDGRRQHPNGRSVASMFGSDWLTLRRRVAAAMHMCASAWNRMPDGEVLVQAMLVSAGQTFGNHWYGSPNWPKLAARYTRLLDRDSAFEEMLRDVPEMLSDETWRQLIRVSYEARAT